MYIFLLPGISQQSVSGRNKCQCDDSLVPRGRTRAIVCDPKFYASYGGMECFLRKIVC